MSHLSHRAVALAAITLLAASACSGSRVVPPAGTGIDNAASPADAIAAAKKKKKVDTTSVLKKLTKQSVIGSTVDAKNGDRTPRGIGVIPASYGLKKGDIVVCNFNNKSTTSGAGTTIEVLAPKAGSKPAQFAQNNALKGCSGLAVTQGVQPWTAGLTAGAVAGFTPKGKLEKTYNKTPIQAPFGLVDAYEKQPYSPEDLYVGDSQTGGITCIGVGYYGGCQPALEIINGFAVNKQKGAAALGPSGVQYDGKLDVLYVADGANNTIVAFQHVTSLLEKDEITVLPGGKTFKCKATSVCGGKKAPFVVYSGSPLNAPFGMAILPNGNLIVANTKGTNTLVELTPTGKVLDKEVVDKGKAGAVFGLVATGTSDTNTSLYFTDANANNVQALTQ